MECDRHTIPVEERNALASELRRLLEKQRVCARQGNLAEVERLAERASAVVNGMAEHGDGVAEMIAADHEDLGRLYHELMLSLRTEQADVKGRLKQLRQARKVLAAYGGRIAP